MSSTFTVNNSQATTKHVKPIVYSIPKAVVEDFINTQAMQEGVSVQLAISIVRAESDFNVNAENASSTASGVWQMIDGTFKEFCIDKYQLTDSMKHKNDPNTQTICAIKMIKDGDLNAWKASEKVWKKDV